MKKQIYILFFTSLSLALLVGACRSSAHVPEGKYMLKTSPTFERVKEEEEKSGLDSLSAKAIVEKLQEAGETTVDDYVLYSSVRTRPNRSIPFLQFKPYLFLYNLGRSLQKYEYPPERFYNFFFPEGTLFDSLGNILVRTGERPAIVDSAQLAKDAENLENVYFSKGFWETEVGYAVDTCTSRINRGKARVRFIIDEGRASIYDTISLVTSNPVLKQLWEANRGKSLLKRGDLYNEDVLSQERSRLSTLFRENGFFTFKPSRIRYQIDTTLRYRPITRQKEVVDSLSDGGMTMRVITVEDSVLVTGDLKPNNKAVDGFRPLQLRVIIDGQEDIFDIRQVRFEIDPARVRPDDYGVMLRSEMLDKDLRKELGVNKSILDEGVPVTFLVTRQSVKKLNLNFLANLLALSEGEAWSLSNERKTLQRLQNLGIFKYVLVKYEKVEADSGSTERPQVDVLITSQLLDRYQFKAGVEGFTRNDQRLSANLPGFGGELGFRDKMLFRGGEHLDLKGNFNLAFYRPAEFDTLEVFSEIGAKANLDIPRIFFPFLERSTSLARLKPHTNFSTEFTYESREEFKRIYANLDWNFSWNHSSLHDKARSSLSPYIITFIDSRLSPAFEQDLNSLDPALKRVVLLDYASRFSSRFAYAFTWADYGTTRKRVTHFLRPGVQFGGNTPFLIDKLLVANNRGTVDLGDPTQVIDTSFTDNQLVTSLDTLYYGQFYKATFEYRNYVPVTRGSELVFRTFIGMARPWNKTTLTPFEARFYGGGSNSMRGWQSRTLGPGNYNAENDTSAAIDNIGFLVSPGGEFVFEANLEYRFNFWSFLELALFTDVGNVWFMPDSDVDFDNAKLNLNTLTQVGWDAGLGIRADFSFFIFRVDLAQQIYAPDIRRFVIKQFPKDLGGGRLQVNFGIGYPF